MLFPIPGMDIGGEDSSILFKPSPEAFMLSRDFPKTLTPTEEERFKLEGIMFEIVLSIDTPFLKQGNELQLYYITQIVRIKHNNSVI